MKPNCTVKLDINGKNSKYWWNVPHKRLTKSRYSRKWKPIKEKDVKVGKLRIKQVLWQLWLKLVKFCCNFSTVILLSAQFWFWLKWLGCISKMRICTLICMLYDLTLHFKIVKYGYGFRVQERFIRSIK